MSLNCEKIEIMDKIVEDNNIEKEKINTVENIELEDCGICGSALLDLDDIVKLKCNHKYHFECITLSYKFSHNKLCPYCRKPSPIPTSKNAIKPIGSCEAILKTGKRKVRNVDVRYLKMNYQ